MAGLIPFAVETSSLDRKPEVRAFGDVYDTRKWVPDSRLDNHVECAILIRER